MESREQGSGEKKAGQRRGKKGADQQGAAERETESGSARSSGKATESNREQQSAEGFCTLVQKRASVGLFLPTLLDNTNKERAKDSNNMP